MDWISEKKLDYDKYKEDLVNELQVIMKYLQRLLADRQLTDKEHKKLKLSIKDVETEIGRAHV